MSLMVEITLLRLGVRVTEYKGLLRVWFHVRILLTLLISDLVRWEPTSVVRTTCERN